MWRLLMKKKPVRPSAVLTICFLLTAALLTSGCSTDLKQGSSSFVEKDIEVTAADMKSWFGTSITKRTSDEQVESLAQQLLTVIGDSQTVGGVTVTLNAAMRDKGMILLSFTVGGDGKLTPSTGQLEREKSGIYSYRTKEELKKALPNLSDQEIQEYLDNMKKLQEGGDDFFKGALELTAFEGEGGSQHMLMQLDTSSEVEIFDVHLEEFGGIAGPFDFHITVPVKGEPLIYTGSIPFMAAGGIEMMLTKVTVWPMSGVSAELILSDSAGTLPENDKEFDESITMDMVRWNGIEVANSSVSWHTEGNTVTTTMNDYAGKTITPEDVTAVRINSQWIELDEMTSIDDSDMTKAI